MQKSTTSTNIKNAKNCKFCKAQCGKSDKIVQNCKAQTKSKTKNLFALLVILAMSFLLVFLSTGCTTEFLQINQKGYNIDRILILPSEDAYTANYMPDGAVKADMEELTGNSNCFNIAYKTGENLYDVIYAFGHYGFKLGSYLYFAQILSGAFNPLWINNNCLFSGVSVQNMADGDTYNKYCCQNTECEKYGGEDKSKNIVEVQTGYVKDGKIVSFDSSTFVCQSCGQTLQYQTIPDDEFLKSDGTYSQIVEEWAYGKNLYTMLSGGSFSAIKFNELIVDGIDFSALNNISSDSEYSDGNISFNRHLDEITSAQQAFDMTDFSYMFSDLPCKKITINNISGLDAVQQKYGSFDMSHMFENCVNLQTVDFGNLFEKLTPKNISHMFAGCPSLQSVDLSSLDTSNVTDMSNMFLTTDMQTKSPFLSQGETTGEFYMYFNRDAYMVAMYNQVTGESVGTIDEVLANGGMTRGELAFALNAEVGIDCPITYTEFVNAAKGTSFASFDEIVATLNANPSAFGLSKKENGEDYTRDEAIAIVKEQASQSFAGVKFLFCDDGQEDSFFGKLETSPYRDRDSYMVATFNSLTGNSYGTMDDILASEEGATRGNIAFEMAYMSMVCPITYTEFVNAAKGTSFASFDEIVATLNANPGAFNIEPKANGDPFTRDEAIAIVKEQASQNFAGVNFLFCDDGEQDSFFSQEEPETPETEQTINKMGTLVLGGTGSKFVIKSGTNIANMFGTTNVFENIVLPNTIDAGVNISLPASYKSNSSGSLSNSIGSANAGETWTAEFPENNPSEDVSETGVGANLLAVALPIALAFVLVAFAKRKKCAKTV